MKRILTILALLITTTFCFAQTKNYLQQVLTKSIISNFFDIDNDNIKFEGEEESGLLINGKIKGYSSIYECDMNITTNSYGKIDGISFSFNHIKSIERYKGLISLFVEKNTGSSINVPINEDFSKKYNLISRINRVDDLFIKGYIKNKLNGFGQLTSLSNCNIFISFISTGI